MAPATALPRRSTRAPMLILGVLLAVAVAARIPLLGGAQIDYDEGVYWESLRAMSAGHPLFSSVYSSQPPGFLALMSAFFAAGHSLVAARSGVLAMFAVAVLATYAVTQRMLGVRAAVIAAALLCADPLMLRQSVALQADGPAVALGMVALAAAAFTAHAVSSRRAAAGSVVAGAALALAVLVKLNGVVVAVPAVLVIFLAPGAPSRPALRPVAIRLGVMALGAAGAAAAVLLPFADRWGLMWSQSVGSHLTARSLQEGGLTGDMSLALARESPVYLAALVGIVVLLRRAPRTGLVMLGWGAAVAALTVAQRPLWPHHLLVASALSAVAAGAPAAFTWRAVSPRTAAGIATAATAALVIAGAGSGWQALDHAFTADTHTGAPPLVARLTRPGDLVVTDDQFAVAAAGRDTPPELVDTAYVRLDSQHVTAAEVEAIIVRDRVRAVYFATGRLERLAGLLDWVRLRFPQATPVPGGGWIYSTAPGSA